MVAGNDAAQIPSTHHKWARREFRADQICTRCGLVVTDRELASMGPWEWRSYRGKSCPAATHEPGSPSPIPPRDLVATIPPEYERGRDETVKAYEARSDALEKAGRPFKYEASQLAPKPKTKPSLLDRAARYVSSYSKNPVRKHRDGGPGSYSR